MILTKAEVSEILATLGVFNAEEDINSMNLSDSVLREDSNSERYITFLLEELEEKEREIQELRQIIGMHQRFTAAQSH
jgi:hypothetical protein